MVSLLSGVQFLKEFGMFTVIMPFLLVFLTTYGLLLYINPFGDNKALNSVLAFVIAFMAIQFMPVLVFLQLMVPYLFALFLVVMLLIVLFKFMGVDDASFKGLAEHPGFYGVIIAVVLIGTFVFISESFPEFKSTSTGTESSELGGIYTGDSRLDDDGASVVVTEGSDGTVTVISEDQVSTNQNLLRNTIFHPTILSLIVMFVTFGVAAYMVVIVKSD